MFRLEVMFGIFQHHQVVLRDSRRGAEEVTAVAVPSTSARTVTAPPPSLMVTKLPGAMSRSICAAARQPDGHLEPTALLNFTSAEMRGQVGDRFQVPPGGGSGGDGDAGVSVRGRRRRQDRQIAGSRRRVNSTASSMVTGVGLRQQVADIPGNLVDGMIFERQSCLSTATPNRRPTSKPLACNTCA